MRRRLPALALLLLAPPPARAHQPGLSRGEYRVDGSTLTAELVFARRELAALVPGADADADGTLDEFELLAVDLALRKQLLAGFHVHAGPDECSGTVTRIVFVEEDGLQIDTRHACPGATLPAVTLRWPLLVRLGPAHRHLGRIVFAAKPVPEDSPAAPPSHLSPRTAPPAPRPGNHLSPGTAHPAPRPVSHLSPGTARRSTSSPTRAAARSRSGAPRRPAPRACPPLPCPPRPRRPRPCPPRLRAGPG
ncbi:MAG: hypothetical protein IPO88_17390 [Nannocystis sp.]|uniref:hypothetical protein n=1 Tax=Nannocystis sp. TaxID=1962667 RepID=UPI0024255D0B|nr:hypothetical protein [Nannocystis sp.]MBK9755239.1 hypothetical protein [Nannocystis sp.]